MRYLKNIIGKLNNELAADLSNIEIERCFKYCISEELLIKLAKTYRDFNILKLKDINKYNYGNSKI